MRYKDSIRAPLLLRDWFVEALDKTMRVQALYFYRTVNPFFQIVLLVGLHSFEGLCGTSKV